MVGGTKKFESDVVATIVKDLNAAMKKASPAILSKVRGLVEKRIMESATVMNLTSGTRLAQEIGVPDIESRVRGIVGRWVNSIVIKFSPYKRLGLNIGGVFRIVGIQADYEDVLPLSDAQFITENAKILPWLEWLLLEGGKSIVQDYTLGISPNDSRTGNLIMTSAQGKSWSVPPEFSGTKNNNFLTRALDGINVEIEAIIQKEINKYL